MQFGSYACTYISGILFYLYRNSLDAYSVNRNQEYIYLRVLEILNLIDLGDGERSIDGITYSGINEAWLLGIVPQKKS